ncbi:MAG: FG-GAP repeat domain-containing protein, partial [Thermoanaerobaculia bacterium]
MTGGRPQFAEVGAAAGIDFENSYYPAFLDRPLRFGMIRYGPGGITAADVDNDGFYDLFVPDGVESRLLRNRRDGTFEDVTAAAGLTGLDGASVGLLADYDNDGWKDLFVSRTFRPNQLFHNEGPDAAGRVRFADVTAGSGLGADCCTTVGSWGDYDLDGDLDLYVGRYLDPRRAIPTTFYARNGEPHQLYRNDGRNAAGRTTFTNVTAAAGVGETGLCLGSVWGDYDDDGDPDLYVVNDFGRNTLYRNNGPDGSGRVTFTDVTVATGTLAYGAGMSASFGDYDNDRRLDIYVANIRSEHSWFAEPPTVWRYIANSFQQGVWRTDMPLYFEIFRQSGLDFVGVFQQMASGNTLLRNRGRGASGEGTFEDATSETGTNPIGWFWGSAFADLDNDGWQDIYSADGWVYNDRGTEIELQFQNNVVGSQREYKKGTFFDPAYFGNRSWHGWERNRHLRNLGPGRSGRPVFREVGRAAGTDLLRNSRGLAVADFWNRGALDLAVAANGDRNALLRNGLAARRGWLGVELIGTRSNRDAVGARVTVRAGGLTQTREVVLG